MRKRSRPFGQARWCTLGRAWPSGTRLVGTASRWAERARGCGARPVLRLQRSRSRRSAAPGCSEPSNRPRPIRFPKAPAKRMQFKGVNADLVTQHLRVVVFFPPWILPPPVLCASQCGACRVEVPCVRIPCHGRGRDGRRIFLLQGANRWNHGSQSRRPLNVATARLETIVLDMLHAFVAAVAI